MEARLSGPQNNKMADRKAEIKGIFGKGKDMDLNSQLVVGTLLLMSI